MTATLELESRTAVGDRLAAINMPSADAHFSR